MAFTNLKGGETYQFKSENYIANNCYGYCDNILGSSYKPDG